MAKSSPLSGARLSILVADRRSGDVIFAEHPERALIPASNQKILTAAAALAVFGPAYRFETPVLANAAIDADGAVARLYIRGVGDPALRSEQWWRLAADLRRAGLRRITEALVLDDSAFDREHWHPAWGRNGKGSVRAYSAPVSALSANYGAFAVRVAPGPKVGGEAWVTIDPPLPYFALRGKVRTAPPGERTRLSIERGSGDAGEWVSAQGQIPTRRKAKTFYRSTARPTLYAGAVIRAALEANDITVPAVEVATPPADALALLEFSGEALSQTLELMMKYSNNHIAEMLVKAMGRKASGEAGSWENGTRVLGETLRSFAVPSEGVVITDGSGLSRGNRASAALLTGVLRRMDSEFALRPAFLNALPNAALDGTLEERARLALGRARAKTGTLNGASALSGFASTQDGEVVFSVISNHPPARDDAVVRAIDRFLEAMVQEPTEPAVARE